MSWISWPSPTTVLPIGAADIDDSVRSCIVPFGMSASEVLSTGNYTMPTGGRGALATDAGRGQDLAAVFGRAGVIRRIDCWMAEGDLDGAQTVDINIRDDDLNMVSDSCLVFGPSQAATGSAAIKKSASLSVATTAGKGYLVELELAGITAESMRFQGALLVEVD